MQVLTVLFGDLLSVGKCMWVALDFSILHFVDLEELCTFVLGTKQSVRTTSLQFHTFASRIYLVRFNVCRKPGLAEPVTLTLGCSK